MKVHSMILDEPKDHRLKSEWLYESDWFISDSKELDKIIKMLYNTTWDDKKGRILCTGIPSKSAQLQNRVFVVKYGHDGKMWSQTTELYNIAKKELQNTVGYK